MEKYGDKWTEAGNIVCNGPFTLEAWEHNKQIVLKKNPHYFGAKDVHLDRVVIPIIPVASGALPYENNELDLDPRSRRATSSACSPTRASRRTSSGIPSPAPGTCCPRSTKPPSTT